MNSLRPTLSWRDRFTSPYNEKVKPAASSFNVPSALVEAVRAGQCVAFVGAGFVQPALPTWLELLGLLCARVQDKDQRRGIREWLKSSQSSRDYEGLAECIKSALGPRFGPSLEEILSVKPDSTIKRRLDFLREVPFRAVLTTNFDGLIDGEIPSPSAYAQVLTAPRRAWWDTYYWKSSSQNPPPCIKLHGRIMDGHDESLVFTTHDYRKRLYENQSYRAFLRALFATHTVLYMGFSFTDAYVNALRSEVLAMLGLDTSHRRGHDFAIMNDVPLAAQQHFNNNEGLEILEYSTRIKGSAKRDYRGFDKWLKVIRARAAPEKTLRELISGKRILWFDPKPDNNRYGLKVLKAGRAQLLPVTSLNQAIAELRKANAGSRSAHPDNRYDLVISHFGWRKDAPSRCEQLLCAMHKNDLRAPVLVFAGTSGRPENRRVALELGAFAFTDTWEELFETLESLLLDRTARNH
jgi:hypothetical protein